ncbi:MAG: chloride channel protein [Proteobacteria bacterium]|nr:chloride channel protein [Pseudomonadota bacterium]
MIGRLPRWIQPGPWVRGLIFWGGAVLTGAVAVALARASDWALRVCRAAAHESSVWPWVAPPLGLAFAAWLTRRFFPGAQGSGIPQTIAALSVTEPGERGRLLSLRIAVGKFLVTILGLVSGASAGREGPTVQIGASIMHSLGRIVRFAPADMDRGLILAGGAAGVAAAFNTPLAGIVFAIEELARSLEERNSGTILTAVILAGITSVALVGNYTYFGVTHAALDEPRMWLIVPVCGVVGGLSGGLFARAMLAVRRGMPGWIAALGTSSPIAVAIVCGFLVAALGWATSGATFGTGYVEAKALVQQEVVPSYWFAPAKALATLASYATGIPAGIFAPSLAIGAGIGGALSKLVSIAPGGATVVLAMAAYFAGVVQAPLTALVIVSEMTGNRALTLPLMGAVLIGRGSSALVCQEALYRALSRSFAGSSAGATEARDSGEGGPRRGT